MANSKVIFLLLCTIACSTWTAQCRTSREQMRRHNDATSRGLSANRRPILKGQRSIFDARSSKCEYSIVINELDSSDCPLMFPPQQAPRQNDRVSNPPNAGASSSLESLTKRVEDIEIKLFQEIAENRDIQQQIMEQGMKYTKMQQTQITFDEDIERVMRAVKSLQITLQKQTTHWQEIGHKLAGVMLDIVEINNILEKTQSMSNMTPLTQKTIPIESTSEKSCRVSAPNATHYRDCDEIYQNGHRRNGVYYITPIYSNCAIPVFCDMGTAPGGWTMIQKRYNGKENFNRNWKDYRHGFGDVTKEFWLGNDNIFLLTNQKHYELRVDMWDFKDSRVYAEYQLFKIDGERDRYRLTIANHTGTAPDGLGKHNNVPFSTPDQDHDSWHDYDCAGEWDAGWWFNNCWFVILNGPYYNTSNVEYRGISWNDWKQEQLKQVEMKIRPSH